MGGSPPFRRWDGGWDEEIAPWGGCGGSDLCGSKRRRSQPFDRRRTLPDRNLGLPRTLRDRRNPPAAPGAPWPCQDVRRSTQRRRPGGFDSRTPRPGRLGGTTAAGVPTQSAPLVWVDPKDAPSNPLASVRVPPVNTREPSQERAQLLEPTDARHHDRNHATPCLESAIESHFDFGVLHGADPTRANEHCHTLALQENLLDLFRSAPPRPEFVPVDRLLDTTSQAG